MAPASGGGAPSADAVAAARDLALARALGDAAARAAVLAPRLGIAVGATRGIDLLPLSGFAPPGRVARRVTETVTVHFATAPVGGDVAVTVTGRAEVAVRPRDRRSNPSIRRAVAASASTAAKQAIADGQAQAARIGARAGYTLVSLRAAVEGPEAAFYTAYLPLAGRFGPGVYCGRVTRVVRTGDGERRRVRRRECRVPRQTTASWTLTFAARPAPAAAG